LTHELAEVLISGIVLGAIYAVMASGMSLVYGVLRVFNFAYGSFSMWSAYFAWFLFNRFVWMTYPAVFAIVLPAMFFFGLAVEKITISPLRHRVNWEILAIMATLGLALFMDNTALAVFGPIQKDLPPLMKGTVNLGGFILGRHEMLTLGVGISIIIVLQLFLKRNRYGMVMRAIAQDMMGARIVGIPLNRAFGYTFGLSAVLVAISGILLVPRYFISPSGGWDILIRAWVIGVFGGMGSFAGTLYAAFILGITESLVIWQLGARWPIVIWFLILMVMLIVRPRGILGTGD
jgi:branched-chain amino acid transport system permease protein